ncbi:MAG: glycoside hydrolase family 3 N-terminal domain-containing protein [Ferruginibacter sp.]
MNKANAWADSVYNSLSDSERIAQLMVVRLSGYDFKNKKPVYFDKKVDSLVQQYNIGGVCVFQGNPDSIASIINNMQRIAKTPVMTCIDAEWGVGMRLFDSVQSLPHQMMLGAMQDGRIVYQYGKLVGEQCKRIGVTVNYAPVVDINNNPNNPVINDRSFGEDKYKVALYGVQYMKGMQQVGVMACAKHFPGHGDVTVDSHLDLPIIHKSMKQLDSLELYPFRKIFNAGIGSVMIAHLYIPSIDSTPNTATSLSKNNVTGLMRNKLGYNGLTFTDALEMQGVKKYFPNGTAAVQSLIAGNDMLCLPEDVPVAIGKIKDAIDQKLLSWDDIELHCKKVLVAKYEYGLATWQPVDSNHLSVDLNAGIPAMKKLVAENAITLLNKTDNIFFPLKLKKKKDSLQVAFVGIGLDSANSFVKRIKKEYHAGVYYFDYSQDSSNISSLVKLIKKRYKSVVIGIHAYNRTPANNFGISKASIELVNQLQQNTKSILFVFGNPYAIKNWLPSKNLVACYEDDSLTQNTAVDILQGKIMAKGKLSVTVSDSLQFGTGIIASDDYLAKVSPEKVGLDSTKLRAIDSIVNDAIDQKATPGCVVLVAKDGKIVYQKAFGYYNYDSAEQVKVNSIYDLASVTKICATTLSIMKLYDEKKIDLNKKLGDYLPWVKGTNKENIVIKDLLLHQAGLVPFIQFYKETIDSNGHPYTKYYSSTQNDSFNIRVAENLYLRNDWKDTTRKRILESPVNTKEKYVYSDNDFIFLGEVIKAVSGLSLDEYVEKNFYSPMGLMNIGFNPIDRWPINRLVPTEDEKGFRDQLLRGYVHDPGAAMLGGIAGHAGLFSDAYDVSVLMQLLLNGGELNGKKYLSKKTIALFTSYQSKISRRGYGFDKPEKDNATRQEPYPCKSASALSFGHSGFTGTYIWVDPKYKLSYIFLSNRVTPNSDNEKLVQLNVRTNIQQAIYNALIKK